MHKIKNVRIKSFKKLIAPDDLRSLIPETKKAADTIIKGREIFENILNGKDKRFVVITGPCSIDNSGSALEYANKLNKLQRKYEDDLFIIMRVYFEKPRTTVGWKGLINDPDLNGKNNIEKGLKIARKLLIDLADMGIATATELLDPIIAAYIAELVCWVAIGARTTESQTHRQMTSGLSAPVGFKNNTDGNLDVAINAMQSAQSGHSFLGVNDSGECAIVETFGNPLTHIVLRGGNGRPNYHVEDIEKCENKLKDFGFTPRIMIDCSHENSGKDYKKQKQVVQDILSQKEYGNESIFGIMLESNLNEGNQKISENMEYGVSLTDSCIGWEETEEIIKMLIK